MKPLNFQIHKLLIKYKKTLAIAESCTGGLISGLLTQFAGSSKYFILGVVSYSNKSKESVLSIPPKIIAKKGAVSAQVAKLMAESVRLIAKSDFGIGITGIAGPQGGSKSKPVGTVFIALDSKNKNINNVFHFSGRRAAIRKKTALKALELLKGFIIG